MRACSARAIASAHVAGQRWDEDLAEFRTWIVSASSRAQFSGLYDARDGVCVGSGSTRRPAARPLRFAPQRFKLFNGYVVEVDGQRSADTSSGRR